MASHCRPFWRRRALRPGAISLSTLQRRAAYSRAVISFFWWCEANNRHSLRELRPVDVAAYVEQMAVHRAAPTVKQHLAAIRMLFDWLVVRQVLPMNPAAAVRGPPMWSKRARRQF